MFTVVKGVEQRGEATQIQEKSGPPQQMAGNPVELYGNDTDIFRPLRHLDTGGPFHHQAVAVVEGQGMEVVHTSGIGHELGKGAVLGNFFVHAMDIAQNRLGLDDVLAVHGHLNAQYAVGGRVLWSQVEHKGFFVLLPGQVHGV